MDHISAKQNTIEDRLLSPSEVAALLGVSTRTFGRIRSRGEFISEIMVGKCPKWTCRAVQEWIDQGGCLGKTNGRQSASSRRSKKKGRNHG